MRVHGTGQAEELALMPHFDTDAFPGIKAELDAQSAQVQGDFVKHAAQADDTAFAHGAIQTQVEQGLDLDAFVGIAQGTGGGLVTGL